MEPPALSAHRLRTRPLAVLAELHAEPQDMVTRRYGERLVHYLRSPKLIEELLATRHDDFTKLNYLPQHGELQQARGRLIMSEERAEHVAARKALGRLMSGAPLAEISLALDEQLARSVHDLPSVLELPEAAYGITADLTAAQLFDPAARADALTAAIERDLGGETPFRHKPREARMRDHDVVAEVIAGFERLSAGDGRAVDALKPLADPFGVSEPELTFVLGGVYAAASETTARALSWFVALVASDEEIQEALAAEVEATALADCALLRAAVLEAIRLFPPSWLIGRFATTETTLGGTSLAPGEVVLVVPYLMHRDERFYASPEEYRPQRFLDATPARWTFLPFGGGRRQCIGERLALAELDAFAYHLLRTFRLELTDGLPRPLPELTLSPEPFRIALSPR